MYQINHQGEEEVVVKIPRFKDDGKQRAVFETLLYETQFVECLNSENIVKIEEELIEYNSKTLEILRYCVIQEKARTSLLDLMLDIWNNPVRSKAMKETF